MVATSKKASIKGALGRRRQKTAPPKTQGGDDTAELDRLVKEKIVSANNNKKWLKVKTALEETPRASNSSTRNWQETRGDECNDDGYSYSDESRDESALEHKSFDSCGSSTMGESLGHCGSSWDDEDQQENAFFEKSVKVETHQAVVKVLEHGNTQMLVLEANPTKGIPKCSEPDDVVIKVDCSTITLQDCMIRRGKWNDMQSLPFIPGSDIVGTITELGSPDLESRFRVGNLVAAVVPSGGNAKYAKVKAKELLLVPTGVDPVTALCISSTYVPAKQSLEAARSSGTPLTGANVLVIGANGPTALATIDLALLEGANVYATADKRHHDHLLSLGVKQCFPVNPLKWLPRLEGKMDVVLDSVCLDGYESSAKALGPRGKLICTGMSATFTQGRIEGPLGIGDLRLLTASYQKARVKYRMHNACYYDKVESFKDQKAIYAQYFKYLCHIQAKGHFKPVVAARASLTMVSSLQKAIERGDTPYGVCVATPWLTREDL